MRTKVTYTQQMLEAREHIAQIKDFYKHLRIFSIATILIFIIKADIFEWFLNSAAIAPSLKDWITWNIISVPIIWAVVLLIHGWVVFRIKFINWKRLKPKALKDWEQNKIAYLLQDEL